MLLEKSCWARLLTPPQSIEIPSAAREAILATLTAFPELADWRIAQRAMRHEDRTWKALECTPAMVRQVRREEAI